MDVNSTTTTYRPPLSFPVQMNDQQSDVDLSNLTTSNIFKKIHDPDYVVVSLYVPVFLMAFIANLMVIIIVIKHHYMRSVTNYFLMNLSVADLLVTLLCMPVAVGSSITPLWFYGLVMCKLVHYLQCVAVATSVFTITSMSIDRYLAITQPMGLPKLLNRRSATYVIGVLWLVSMVMFSPLLWVCVTDEILVPDFENLNITLKNWQTSSLKIITEQNSRFNMSFFNTTANHSQEDIDIHLWNNLASTKYHVCKENWSEFGGVLRRSIFGYFNFILMYIIPGFIMTMAYSLMGKTLCSVRPPFDSNEGRSSTQQSYRLVRERKRVAWLLLLLAVLFAVCWLPYSVLNLLLDTGGDTSRGVRPYRYALLLGHANSAVNPLLYCFMTKHFRRSVRDLWRRRHAPPVIHSQWSARRRRRCQIRLIARFNTTKYTADAPVMATARACSGDIARDAGAILCTACARRSATSLTTASTNRSTEMEMEVLDHWCHLHGYVTSMHTNTMARSSSSALSTNGVVRGGGRRSSSGYDSCHSMAPTPTKMWSYDNAFSQRERQLSSRDNTNRRMIPLTTMKQVTERKAPKQNRLCLIFKRKKNHAENDAVNKLDDDSDIVLRDLSSNTRCSKERCQMKHRKRVEFI